MGIYNIPEKYQDRFQRNLRLGYGSLVPIRWKEEAGEEIVSRQEDFYVGKITLGQTGTIVATLAAMFINGQDLQKTLGQNDWVTFINSINPDHLGILLGTIVGKPAAWVDDNLDLRWVIPVLAAFFKHNDFFAVLEQVGNLMEQNGFTQESLAGLVAGQTAGS